MYVLWIVVCLFVLFLLVVVLSVFLRYTDSYCPFGIFKLFLSFCTFSIGRCVVCFSSIYGFLLPLWYLQTLLVLLYFFYWSLCCLFFFDIRILIAPLVSSNSSCPFVLFLLVVVLSVFLRYTDSFGIFKLFLSFCTFSIGRCVVCFSSIYGFLLPLWYLQTLLVLLYFFYWSLCCLFFFDIRILIAPLVSSNSSCLFVLFLLVVVLSVFLRNSSCLQTFCLFVLFLLVVVLSVFLRYTDSYCLPLVSSNSSCLFVLFLLVVVLSVFLRYTDSYCPFGIFKLFLSFCTFSIGRCVVCFSSIYGFLLPPFGIFKLFLTNQT